MAAIYKVARGRTLALRDRRGVTRLLSENVILQGEVQGQELRDLVKAGFIDRMGGEDESEPDALATIKNDGTVEKAPPPPPRALGLWNVDPKKIATKNIDQLNVMIAEKDPNVPPAASVDEAVKILSADFQG